MPDQADQPRVAKTRAATTRRTPTGQPQRRRPRVAGQPQRPSTASGDDRTPQGTDRAAETKPGRSKRASAVSTLDKASVDKTSLDPRPDEQSTDIERRRPRGRRPLVGRVRPGAEALAAEPADPDPDGAPAEHEAKPNKPTKQATARWWPPWSRVVVLATVLGIAVGLIGLFAVGTFLARSDPIARNTAMVDLASTTQAVSQVSNAMERVYSFDYNRLDETERAAREALTPEFAVEYNKLFAQVRQLAPQQKSVVRATVAMAAVKELAGDRAVLVMFLDQERVRADNTAPILAGDRVTVMAQLIDGRWRIAGVESR